jgi:arylformamidase
VTGHEQAGRNLDGSSRLNQDTLDRQYSPSSCVPSLQRYLDEYSARSAAARQHHEVRTDLHYWPHPDQTLDLFPVTAPGAPVQIFVHGGNWQELTKDSSAFAAPQFVLSGAAFAVVNYGLAPTFPLDEIVAMVRRCVRWLHAHADQLGFDPDRMYLSGTSAGAHLAAMALVPDLESDQLDIARQIAGVTLMSGMYDLEPVRCSYINRALGMDRSAARRNSPIRWLPSELPPVVIARGENETEEFIRQHDLMTATLLPRTSVVNVVAAARNHFDLPYDLGVKGTELGDAVWSQMGLTGADKTCSERN